MKKIILIICLCVFIFNGCGQSIDLPTTHSTEAADERTTTPSPNPGINLDTNENVNSDNNEADNLGPLKDIVICIDPGHGNPEIDGKQEKIAPNSDQTKPGTVFGAVGIETKVPEYKVNMSVSLKLKGILEEQGCTVLLARQSNDENLGNIDRAMIGNNAKSNLVIRIHADSSTNQKAKGLSVLYPGNKYISDEYILTQSKSAAQYVHDAIIKATDANPRGIIKREDLTGFNWSTQPTILVEMGFLSNAEEDRLLNDTAYQDKITVGILEGILNYFKSITK